MRRYLEAYSTTITHVGPVGSGQLVKLVNQILVVGNQMAVSEAFLFAKRAGLDLEKTLNAVKGGAAGSWMLANRGPQMIADDWRPGFTIDLQQKDLRLVLDAADDQGTPLPGHRSHLPALPGPAGEWSRRTRQPCAHQGIGAVAGSGARLEVRDLIRDLRAEQEDLDRILAGLDDPAWDTVTPAEPWTIRDTVSHLAFFDEKEIQAIRDPAGFAAEVNERLTNGIDRYMSLGIDRGRSLTPSQVLDWWRTARKAELLAFASIRSGRKQSPGTGRR